MKTLGSNNFKSFPVKTKAGNIPVYDCWQYLSFNNRLKHTDQFDSQHIKEPFYDYLFSLNEEITNHAKPPPKLNP